MNRYVGNPLQTRGAEQFVLQNSGKGSGMRFLYVRNGRGLELWISLDRAGDISRVTYKGDELAYFSPCGYVAPTFYERRGFDFLKSFTAGFFTTCGLTNCGAFGTEDGEELPFHGSISHIPAVLNGIEESEEGLKITLTLTVAEVFRYNLILKRVYTIPYTADTITVTDTVTNATDKVAPHMVMYHCNMGYPLLSETSTVRIPHTEMIPSSPRAESQKESALQMEPPQDGYKECCYFYDIVPAHGNNARVGIYSPEIDKGVILSYDKTVLPYFTEWKMMGSPEYVLGLEPGNCRPEGRPVARANGRLSELKPGESKTTELTFCFTESAAVFEELF